MITVSFRPARRSSAIRRLVVACMLTALSGSVVGPGSVAASEAAPAAQADSREAALAAFAVLDRYMDALNALDLEGHLATYHFPHFRYASGELTVWESAREAMPILDSPEPERRAWLLRALGDEWARSEWTRRDIVQADATKIHVVTTFVRFRSDGSEIASFDSFYILTFDDGSWGIRGRSSFAP